MKIKDIVRTVGLLTGRSEIVEGIDNGVTEASNLVVKTINTLVDLTNLVISELSTTYVPLVCSEKVKVVNGQVTYGSLKNKALRIRDVYLTDGQEIMYKKYFDHISVSADTVVVEYEYLPVTYGLTDEIDYKEKDVTVRTLAYGVLAEFSISEGRFDEAVTWHKRYVDALAESCFPKNSQIKNRDWL